MFLGGVAVLASAFVRAAMPLDANAELGSAYRCDLPGPEVWTSTCGGKSLDGTADGYFKTEVPARRFGVPAPGMSGLLYVVHTVPGLKDPCRCGTTGRRPS